MPKKSSIQQEMRERKEKLKQAGKTLREARKAAHSQFTADTKDARRRFNSRTRKARQKLEESGEKMRQERAPVDRSYYAAQRKADQLVPYAQQNSTDEEREARVAKAREEAAAIRQRAEARWKETLEPIVSAYRAVADQCEPVIEAQQKTFDQVLAPAQKRLHEALEDAQEAYEKIANPDRPYSRRPFPEPLETDSGEQ